MSLKKMIDSDEICANLSFLCRLRQLHPLLVVIGVSRSCRLF